MRLISGADSPTRTPVGSLTFDALDTTGAAAYVRDRMARGAGGRLVVIGAPAYRRAASYQHVEPAPRQRGQDDGTVVLAAWAPTVWASRLTSRRAHWLPERVDPAMLIEQLCLACVADRRRLYLIGGAPGRPGVPGGAQRAAAVLGLRYRGLRIVGCASPGTLADTGSAAALAAGLREAKPDLVLIDDLAGAERVVMGLRADLPGAWFVHCGGLISSTLGEPPGRLSRVPRDAVMAVRLLASAATRRLPAIR